MTSDSPAGIVLRPYGTPINRSTASGTNMNPLRESFSPAEFTQTRAYGCEASPHHALRRSRRLTSRPVLRPARVRLPQHHLGHLRARPHAPPVPANLFVKILGQVFRRRIHALEGLKVVHELVIQPPHDFANN